MIRMMVHITKEQAVLCTVTEVYHSGMAHSTTEQAVLCTVTEVYHSGMTATQ